VIVVAELADSVQLHDAVLPRLRMEAPRRGDDGVFYGRRVQVNRVGVQVTRVSQASEWCGDGERDLARGRFVVHDDHRALARLDDARRRGQDVGADTCDWRRSAAYGGRGWTR
jgi:hypothetical protein